MSPDQLAWVWGLSAGIVVLVGLSAAMLIREARRRDIEERVVRAVWGEAAGTSAREGVTSLLHALGERIRRSNRFYSQTDLEHLQGLIQAAGHNPRKLLPLLLGVKLVIMVVLPAVAVAVAYFAVESLRMRILVVGAGVIGGILAPEWILGMLRRSYVAALERGTPDALDLLVVCSEAGMGLESALERISEEMFHSNRPMAVALSGLLDDLRVLPDRREAFANFGSRSGVEGLQRMATMLGQSLQYGTPVSQALRAVAAELRRERMNRLEENAVKLPAKLIFPMIFFIMPSLYIVLLGTSFMRLFDSLKAFTSHLHH